MYHGSDTFMSNKQDVQLESKIRRIKDEIAAIGDMRPGSLSQQQRKTGKDAYGEYWQLSYTFQGKGRTEYVPTECVAQVSNEIQNYKRYRELFESLVEHSIELSRLRIRAAKEKQKS